MIGDWNFEVLHAAFGGVQETRTLAIEKSKKTQIISTAILVTRYIFYFGFVILVQVVVYSSK